MVFRSCLIRRRPLSATQKLVLSSIIVYAIISCMLFCFLEENRQQQGSSIGGYFSSPYQEMVPSRAAKDNVLRIFHTEDSLCLEKPKDLSIPVDSFDVAIMFQNGGCSVEKKAQNIAEWYQKENPKVRMALIYNWTENTKQARKKEDVVGTVGNKSYKSIIVRGEDQNNLPTSLQLHYITENYFTKIIDMITNSSYQIADGPNNNNVNGTAMHSVYANFNQETEIMSYESACANVFLVQTISLIITVAFQIRFWKGFFSIRFTSEGIIVYSSTDSGNVNSAEVKPPKLLTEDQVNDLFPEIGYGAEGSISLENKGGIVAKSETQCKFRSSSEQCSICLDDFDKGDRLRVLHCGHMYHTDCIMPWLTKQRSNCPMCKKSFEDLETGRKER